MKRCTHCPPLHASCSRAHWSARRQRGRPSPTAERIKATARRSFCGRGEVRPDSTTPCARLAAASPPSEVCVLDDASSRPRAECALALYSGPAVSQRCDAAGPPDSARTASEAVRDGAWRQMEAERFAPGVDSRSLVRVSWEGDEGGCRGLAYRYVWRGDLFDTFDESVRVWTSVGPSQFDQSVCHVRATVPDPLKTSRFEK